MSKMYRLSGSVLQPVKTGGIPLGQVIHSDQWGLNAVVVESEPSSPFGQQAIGTNGTTEHHVVPDDIGRRAIPFWKATEIICTPEHCEVLRDKLAEHKAKDRLKSKLDAASAAVAEKLGAAYLAEHRPQWAQSVIVAELQQDESDLETDYFASKTTTTRILAWSKHLRDLFPELRRAAKRCSDLPTHWVEHREKYSMGKGYYLAESQYSQYSGWHIRKRPVADASGLDLIIGRAIQVGNLEGVYFA